MTLQDHAVKLRQLAALREAVRRAIYQTRVSMDMPDTASTDATIVEALRDVSQTHALRMDADIDISLNNAFGGKAGE